MGSPYRSPFLVRSMSIPTVDEATRYVQQYNNFASRIEELGLPAQVDAKTILGVSG